MSQNAEYHHAKQCVVLAGGQGTRLGNMVRNTPKPMLEIDGKPFLVHLIGEFARFGFHRFLLLTGYKTEIVQEYFSQSAPAIPAGVDVTIVKEKEPLGTGGALCAASGYLDETFVLCNGDSLCLFNYLRLITSLKADGSLARMAVMPVEDNTRYGEILLAGNHVTGFAERSVNGGSGIMNTGIYFMHREIVNLISPGKSSLERDVFPHLAASGLLQAAQVSPHFFIDIGVPKDFARAQKAVSQALCRPAVFFDRDGVLNQDHGHVHSPDNFHWIDGAKESILACNDAGYYVFVVTNQAGIAKGYYAESAMHALHAHMQEELHVMGAHVDAFAFCPHHPEGIVPDLRQSCSCRKPEPGMILRLCEEWAINPAVSLLIGDKPSDIQAAKSAGIHAYLFSGGNLLDTLLPHLRTARLETPA